TRWMWQARHRRRLAERRRHRSRRCHRGRSRVFLPNTPRRRKAAMKHRRIYSTPNLAAAHAALGAARDTGIEPDSLSLIARADIEMDAVPDDMREAHTDMIPAALRGAAGGGAVG